MKKIWSQPTLEVLEVEMTMANPTGTHYDADISSGQAVGDDLYTPLDS